MPAQPTTPPPLKVLRTTVQALEIAADYLHSEFAQLFAGRSTAFYTELAQSMQDLPQRLGERMVWQLLAGVSEGYKLNWAHRILSNPGFTWRLEELPLDALRMTGMNPTINTVMIQAQWQPSRFAALWQANPTLAARTTDLGIDYRPHDTPPPLLAYEKAGSLRVFDGMHRLCAAALGGQPTIRAFVGRVHTPVLPRLNPDKPMFLLAAYRDLSTRTPEDLAAVVAACALWAKTHSNGRTAVERALAPWGNAAPLKKAAAAIRAAIR